MTAELKVMERNAPPTKTMLVHEREKFSQEAEFARGLIHSWGGSAILDGEDSRGSARLRPVTPEELVERVMTVTQLAMEAFRKNGWIISMPSIEEITQEDSHKPGF